MTIAEEMVCFSSSAPVVSVRKRSEQVMNRWMSVTLVCSGPDGAGDDGDGGGRRSPRVVWSVSSHCCCQRDRVEERQRAAGQLLLHILIPFLSLSFVSFLLLFLYFFSCHYSALFSVSLLTILYLIISFLTLPLLFSLSCLIPFFLSFIYSPTFFLLFPT